MCCVLDNNFGTIYWREEKHGGQKMDLKATH